MNLGEFRSRISFATGLSNVDDSDEQGMIDSWVNEAVIQFLTKTKIYLKRFGANLTAGEDSYDVDDDILAMKSLWVETSGGQTRLIEPATTEEVMSRQLLGGASGAWPVIYALNGSRLLMLHPAAQSSSDKLHGLYVPLPTAMTGPTHDPSNVTYGGIPTSYHTGLEAYATMRAAAADDKATSPSFGDYRTIWDEAVLSAKVEINKKAGIYFAPARPEHRRFPYAPTPGTDIGW